MKLDENLENSGVSENRGEISENSVISGEITVKNCDVSKISGTYISNCYIDVSENATKTLVHSFESDGISVSNLANSESDLRKLVEVSKNSEKKSANEQKNSENFTEETVSHADNSSSYFSPYETMLTTVDNPFDPFTNFDEWFDYDEMKGYHSCAYLARIADVTDDMSEEEEIREVERAIDEIIRYDFMNIYRKVKRPLESTEDSPEGPPGGS